MAKKQNQDSNNDLFLKIMRKKNQEENKKNSSIKKEVISSQNAFDKISVGLNAINSMLDRVLSTNSAIKILSFCLTIILVFSINGGSISNVFTTPTSGDILTGIDVEVIGLSKDYVVTGVPDQVDVMMVGSSLDIYSAKASNDIGVYIDVTNLSRGEHTVDLKTKNFPSGLEVVVQPGSTAINITSKVTQTFPLTHRFINLDLMDERYSIALESLSQETIEVRGAQSVIEQVHSVEVNIDTTGVTDSFTKEFKVYAYDAIGTILPVDITPSLIEVSCDVTSYSKEVHVIARIQGELPEGVAIKNITFDNEFITIYGKQDLLSSINEVYVDIDASLVTGNVTLDNLNVRTSEGINKYSQSIFTAQIEVGTYSSRVVKDIEFDYVNNTEKYDIEASVDKVSIEFFGEQSILDALTVKDIVATIDIKGLALGEHKLPIAITLHNPYLTYEFVTINNITITIKE